MAKFTDYTEKTEPVDTDLALIYDTPAKVNKKFTFGNLWKWIAKKIVSEGISQLETTNKTIPGAINEVNSNVKRKDITGKSISIDLQMYKTAIVFGTIKTTSETLLLVTRQYNNVIVVESLHGASKEGVTGIVDSNTNTVTITFPEHNSAIIIW